MSGLDRPGSPTIVEGEGLLARMLHNEIDHLEGILSFAGIADPTCLWNLSERGTAATVATAQLPSKSMG